MDSLLPSDPSNIDGYVIEGRLGSGGLYETPDDVETMIAETRSAVVEVKCGNALGSGWPLSTGSQTVIVTNHHVIEACLDPLVPVTINFAGGSVSADDLYMMKVMTSP